MNKTKKGFRLAMIPSLAVALLLCVGAWYVRPASGGSANVVKITLKKFEYEPGSISVKKGAPVILELTSADTGHGFNLPDFGVRADVKRGATSRVEFTPNKAGKFTFYCDVFCGSGHEDMSGTLTVTD